MVQHSRPLFTPCGAPRLRFLALEGLLPFGPFPPEDVLMALNIRALAVSIYALAAAMLFVAGSAAASDGEIERVTSMIRGSWISTSPVETAGGTEAVPVVMHIEPVAVPGLPHAMYVEQSRADAMHQPYRQTLFQLYRFGGDRGEVRLRTYEFKNTPGIRPTLVGLWLVPDLFPELSPEGMYATLDLILRADGNGFVGETPYPYPTGAMGAVQMTSSIEVRDGKLITTDTGYKADGTRAWGGEALTFERYDSTVAVQRNEDGLVVIDFTQPTGAMADNGSTVTVHYRGWTRDMTTPVFGGAQFDASWDRPNGPEPFSFDLPGRLIDGWNRGIPGATKGTIRRLIIPSALAYGERGAAGGRIAPNADLFFEIEVLDVTNARETAPVPGFEDEPAEASDTE